MRIMYVDESGDPGQYKEGANTKYFMLTGFIIDHDTWNDDFAQIKSLRDNLKSTFDFPKRLEIHGSDFISVRKLIKYRVYKKKIRMEIFKSIVQSIPKLFPKARIINICIDKTESSLISNYQKTAWNRLIQRFDTHLKRDADEKGMIFADQTDNSKIVSLMRQMRAYNPIPSKYSSGETVTVLTDNIIEDPVFRDSAQSHFIQIADVIVTSLRLKEYPKGALKKYNAHRYFDYLDPLLIKAASSSDPLGIVRK